MDQDDQEKSKMPPTHQHESMASHQLSMDEQDLNEC